VVRLQRTNAATLGFTVANPPPPGEYGPGPVPPSLNCTQQNVQGLVQQVQQGAPGVGQTIPAP
jgi:hypothetical protein